MNVLMAGISILIFSTIWAWFVVRPFSQYGWSRGRALHPIEFVLIVLALLAFACTAWYAISPADAADLPADNYTRPCEASFTPESHRDEQAYPRPTIIGYGDVAQMLYPDMTEQEKWFIAKELAFLNDGVWDQLNMTNPLGIVPWSMTLTVPVYQRTDKSFCGDIRNWHVAVMKGRKYSVSPALMIAIRSHENPKASRDRYAYGVVAKKHTNLWVQAEWAARIIARISVAQGWSSLSPTQANLYALGAAYCVGVSPSRLSATGRDRARRWSRNVWELYQRARP